MSDPGDIVNRHRMSVAADYAFPIPMATASGTRLTDLQGKTYLDFIGGYGVVNTGWQRPEIVQAIEEQARTLAFSPPWLPSAVSVELAEELLRLAPASVHKVARAASGAEANEIAVKAHYALRGGQLLVVGRAYHGGTLRTLAMSDPGFGLPPSPQPRDPSVPPANCFRCPWGKTYPTCGLACLGAIRQALDANPSITGIMLEPILGSGGAIAPPREYLVGLQQLCRERGLSFLVDEVITGCGRTGRFFACDYYGLQPDAITLAKGLGGGYATIGATLLSQELADALARYEDVSSTLAWTPLAAAAASANVRLLVREQLAEKATHLGSRLLAGLRHVFETAYSEHLGDVRGLGMLMGVELVQDQHSLAPAPRLVKRIVFRAMRAGLMIGSSWDWSTLVFLPPLTLTESEIDEGVEILSRVLTRTTGPS